VTVPLMRQGERWSCVHGADDHVHVLPEHDGRGDFHVLADCWCCPKVEYVDPTNGRHVFVHRAIDEAN
jgi:hypothetical protein